MELFQLYIKSLYTVISMLVIIVINMVILLQLIKLVHGCLSRAAMKKGGHVLLTGCDSGFGFCSALELSQQGIHVFAACLTQQGVQLLTDNATFSGTAFVMDVTKESDIDNARNMIEDVAKEEGLWALVNNAGITKLGLLEWQSVEEMQQIMDVNLWGAVKVTKAMLPLLKRSRGRVVNVSSMGGRTLVVNATAYSMSKYATEAFSDGLRFEMKPWGVSVHIIEPGFFRTNLTDFSNLRKGWEDTWNRQPDDVKKAYGEEYLNNSINITEEMVGMMASPRTDKVANAVCHAVLSSSAKLRYPVGFDAHTIWMANATLPTTMGDMLTNLLVKRVKPAAAR